MKENKKNLKLGIFLLLVLSSFGLTHLPKTYSRYVDGGQLVYKANLYNMYNEYTMEIKEAKLETAKLEFTFLPNKAIVNKKDRYEITIPSTCTFDSVISKGEVKTVNDKTKTITFNPDTEKGDTNIITMTCKIDPNKEYVDFTSKINEIIVDENRKLAYIKYTFKESYQDYLKRISIGVENPKTIPYSENIYDIFIKWITEYAKSIHRETEILSYVKNTYPNKEALIHPNNYEALLGFKISYNSAKKEYTFHIVDNFVGYARTYYENHTKIGQNEMNLYFSTTDRDLLNQAFKHYLNLYAYPNNTTSVNSIYKYVTDKQGIYSVIFYGNTGIKGLELVNHDTKTLDTQIKLTKNTILNGSNDYLVSPPQVDFDTYKNMLMLFRSRLESNYSNIPLEVKQAIYYREEIKDSITKNCTRDKNNMNVSTPPVAFTDYFIHKDNNRYLLVKIASTGQDYNTFEIEELTVPSGMTISFENKENNTLKVSVSHTTKTSVMDIVAYLNTYFKTNITESNVTVLSDTSSSYAIEYTITK